ncbi:MAG: thioredoxin domain-containing protein [Nitrospirae bacterium]|nr:thioredoxin domain-containing protein [Nitrospirota bacterium]
MNRLSMERSAYLQHAANQKIDWYPWSDEAFEKAGQEDKPVFLSTGAVWCHWCHVMAKESFEDDEVAGILNQNFICIKLDRDERPDIDKRYQQAVSAMGNSGGWPLSVFLTPDRKAFYGGTYFPPGDSHGRPGFRKVLLQVAGFYRSKRDEADDYGRRLMEYLRPAQLSLGELDMAMLDPAATMMLSELDAENGGFGTAPKFPMAGALEYLMNRFFFSKNEFSSLAARKTLESMAKGGFHDQLGGGFHRYSVDQSWIVPHFEKMADDNAWLLKNYIHAYAIFGDEQFRYVAEGIVQFVMDVLSDPQGGFYASQDADVTPDDEGGYFTWTQEELRRLLSDEQYSTLTLHLFHERGAMHHDPGKKVLFVAVDADEIASQTGLDIGRVKQLIGDGKRALLQARNLREAPYIDRTLYTSLNGMMISSFLHAYMVIKKEKIKDFALLSLERVVKRHLVNGELYHSEGVKGVLDDYIYMVDALLTAYEVTADPSYLKTADDTMKQCIVKFWDRDSGGFFDTAEEVLGIRLKAVEDIPHPSSNGLAIMQLLRLFHMTSEDTYLEYAERALRLFSKIAQDLGLHAGYYFCALNAYYQMVRLTVQASSDSELGETARRCFYPYKVICYGKDNGLVVPCLASGVCLEPLGNPGRLREFLKNPS